VVRERLRRRAPPPVDAGAVSYRFTALCLFRESITSAFAMRWRCFWNLRDRVYGQLRSLDASYCGMPRSLTDVDASKPPAVAARLRVLRPRDPRPRPRAELRLDAPPVSLRVVDAKCTDGLFSMPGRRPCVEPPQASRRDMVTAPAGERGRAYTRTRGAIICCTHSAASSTRLGPFHGTARPRIVSYVLPTRKHPAQGWSAALWRR